MIPCLYYSAVVPSTVYRPSAHVYRIPSKDLQSTISTAHRLPSTAYRLPPIYRPPSTAYRPPSTVNRLPRTPRHPPPTIHHLFRVILIHSEQLTGVEPVDVALLLPSRATQWERQLAASPISA
jgi:hypothetical protein